MRSRLSRSGLALGRRFAGSLRSRRRGNLLFVRIVLAHRFRVFLSFALVDYLMFDFRLIFDELDVGYLRFGRQRNEEEEREDEARNHQRKVEDVRTARSLGYRNHIFRIYMPALNQRCVIVSIANCVGDESDHQS
jgi:hypothetical protein